MHFFEDFSTTAIGQKPIGWYAKTNHAGIAPVVASLEGTETHWVILAGNSLIPNGLKKPLPHNFTFSYDVSVPENFTWGAKGLILVLAKEKSEGVSEAFISLKLRPGSGGANGEVTLETKFPAAYANGTKYYVAEGFSNNKKLNHITSHKKKESRAGSPY